MAKSLDEILHYQNITKVVSSVVGGVPSDIIPAGFLSLTNPAGGSQITYDLKSATRQTAKSVQPGSPSVRRALQTIGQNSTTIPRFAEHIQIVGDKLTQLRGMGSTMRQQKAMDWVMYQFAEQGRRFQNTRISMVCSALRHGKIYLKSDNEGGYDLLPTSSGADITIDLKVPANNTGSLNGTLTDWSTASTSIIDEIQAVLELALKTTGLPIRHVLYGPSVRGYILANTEAQTILNTDSGMANSLKQGAIPNGFGDAQLQWHPMQRAFFADADGTNQDWFTGDEVIFVPEPTRDWYEMVEGSELLPDGSLGAHSDGMAALDATMEVFGAGGYAKLKDDPVAVKNVLVDNSLPVFYVPGAVFTGDCTN